MPIALRDVVSLLDGWYDPAWAESWDAVGLVTGDPEQPVRKVLFAVDPAPAVVEEAVAWGADLVVVHHPLLLTPVSSIAATTPKGRVLHTLARHGIALLTAHTNADVPADGVNESLARAVGIADPRVVVDEGRSADNALDKLTYFVPRGQADVVRDAVADAGAGQVGDYDRCSFSSPGEGRFRPLEGANPTLGAVGEVETVEEVRVECVLRRSQRRAVVAALLAAHPYETPAYDVVALANDDGPSDRGHGRIGRLAAPTTLREFADRVRDALPGTAHGVRVSGDPDRRVETVVVGSGAGDYLLDVVLGTGADVYVTSDLRHHRAAEFREHDGPALVDVAHWAAEWTWLPVAARKLAAALEERGGAGATVETRVSTTVTDPWTFRVD
ncbi:Nif3-like dinuclear metal center hexameric protein [Nocardioides iriomotensis]|uniref:GTP cyclohydrolase 1 type 2 homolog n=1 Tax=Nocardioides iriomotensis TaxID=715784 RepID=A0A4Q5IUQ6_9ACTN|nr:Nif3-like dinuclear metal center hexameric protein [Nocardioides iriomotensis]RYU09493.1 Nif3-like dinuclear metal center hexameric protein [Nocardioides iriomotensis]